MTVATIPRGLLIVCLAAGGRYIAICQKTELIQVRDNRPLMGTAVEMALEGIDDARLRRATDNAYRKMTRLLDMMNHYDPCDAARRPS